MTRFNAKKMREISEIRANPTAMDMYLRLSERGRKQIRVAAEKGRTAVQFLAKLDYLKMKDDEKERAAQLELLRAVAAQLKSSFEAVGFTVTAQGDFLLTISWGEA